MVAENRWYVQRLELGFAFSIDLLVTSDDSSLKLIFCAYRYCVWWRTWQLCVYIWNAGLGWTPPVKGTEPVVSRQSGFSFGSITGGLADP